MRATQLALSFALLAVPLFPSALRAEPADADNTERNVRDRDDKTLTPLDQGESEADRKITQEVRKAVVADDSLSMNAHNVKIITVDGAVTLRGPVKSNDEKAKIASIAKKVAGAKSVDDQLEIEVKK